MISLGFTNFTQLTVPHEGGSMKLEIRCYNHCHGKAISGKNMNQVWAAAWQPFIFWQENVESIHENANACVSEFWWKPYRKNEVLVLTNFSKIILFKLFPFSSPERLIWNRRIRECKFANSDEEERTQSLEEVSKVITKFSLHWWSHLCLDLIFC